MSKIQYRKAAFYESKETITESLTYLDSIKNKTYWAVSMNELAHNFLKLGDYDLAESFYKKAIDTDPKKDNKVIYSNNLALLYVSKNDLRKSISLLEDVLQELPKSLSKKEKARLEHNLALSEWKLSNKNPLPVFLYSLQIRKSENDAWGLLSSYSDLLDYYLPMNSHIAEKYSDSLIQVSKSLQNPNAEIQTLAKFLQHNPKKYAELAPRYVHLKDSIEISRQAFKNQFAYLKYSDEQEKARLQALETETAQNEAQLAREETQRILLLSLLAVLLMGGGSYYFILRQQHKKRTLQEIYNTEKKISKKIHDGLANDVYGVMTAVQHQDKTPNEAILDQLEDIYRRTRDISHDTRELATGKAFAIELKDMLQGFSGNGTKVLIKGMEGISWEKLNIHKCVALHRTLKELLVNMKKHSGAGLVALNFKEEKRRLQVDYSDNGIGVKRGQQQGVGLQNTENRIQSVGGQFIFGGVEGKGVKVTLSIPI
ncbi:hypothetical protein L0P88_05385 [Muricauda sp. SCSIO 64092]|uniref:tetratricopeptide repeat-containing sensor histidine kinase n=1 Tax=Allomuricauda sp. SCSIO 64092 TaxID=2908842 RepID=UPI001FF549D6|nr:tetratricopeptide repeat-containing sensor histidine kinase [Muricauda sp. SCSIO 64092]UOY07984.1 hypothetical protein L0P88_05385 [Muricauda sp. SCSIO 64092]